MSSYVNHVLQTNDTYVIIQDIISLSKNKQTEKWTKRKQTHPQVIRCVLCLQNSWEYGIRENPLEQCIFKGITLTFELFLYLTSMTLVLRFQVNWITKIWDNVRTSKFGRRRFRDSMVVVFATT